MSLAASPAMALPSAEDTMRGVLLATLGYLVISCADAAVKWALPEVGPAMAMLWRGGAGALVVVALCRGRGLWPRNTRLLAARSLLHCCVSAAWYLAWARGVGLADSYAVAAFCPVLMTLLAIPLLGEQVGWRRWCSCMVGFAGVLFMLRPGGDLWRWEMAVLVVATFAMATTRIWTRTLSRTDNAQTISFCLLVAHAPVGLAMLFIPGMGPPGGGWPQLPGWGVLLALVVFGVANGLAQMLFARAFALSSVGVLAPFEYAPLLWGTVLGFLLWRELPTLATLAGAAVVASAGLYNWHRERVRRAEERARMPA